MADDETAGGEDAGLRDALAAEHAAVWGYGVVGAALPPDARAAAEEGELAHRDVRDRLAALLDERGADPVPAEAGYTLPFPVLSAVDAAALGVVLEEGVSASWVALLDAAEQASVRQLAVTELQAAEGRAVGWRAAAGRSPVTTALPGLPDS
ncbi:ferritin-like domain-containing protein [Geodermatophilus sp. URMC 62]|uniref:ferritin-like domain-containing protein n=1 Tax=Geodermatophilus sp. URMC 62 TaxID=3423414 RepID=UPI00406D2EB7